MAKKQKKPEEPAGESAPMWIVSFADLVTLMMSFFVVLYALKQGGPQQQLEQAAAIKAQFGYQPPDDSTDPLDLQVMAFLGRIKPPMQLEKGRSEAPPRGADGNNPEVTTIRPGKDITTGGLITFEPGSVAIDETSHATIRKLADLLRGHNNVLMIKGHVSSDELSLRPDDPDGLSLSNRRAMAVKDALVALGIDHRVLRPVACGPFEPVKVQVYDPLSQRLNRRVEIYNTDSVASDYMPSTLVPASTRGGAENQAADR